MDEGPNAFSAAVAARAWEALRSKHKRVPQMQSPWEPKAVERQVGSDGRNDLVGFFWCQVMIQVAKREVGGFVYTSIPFQIEVLACVFATYTVPGVSENGGPN